MTSTEGKAEERGKIFKTVFLFYKLMEVFFFLHFFTKVIEWLRPKPPSVIIHSKIPSKTDQIKHILIEKTQLT